MKIAFTSSRLLLCFLSCLLLAACNKNTPETTSQVTAQQSAKRYHLKGKVVSIDKPGKMANIDAEAIPGFMDAMAMPYEVRPATELDKLHPGDAVTADVVVQNDSTWLENIVVIQSSSAGKSK